MIFISKQEKYTTRNSYFHFLAKELFSLHDPYYNRLKIYQKLITYFYLFNLQNLMI